jgi:sortase A
VRPLSAAPGTSDHEGVSREGIHSLPRRSLRTPVALTVGLLGLGLVAWSLVDLRITSPAQDPPVTSANGSTRPVPPTPPPERPDEITEDVPVVLYPEKLVEGDSVGTISLPTLDLHWPIFEGTTSEQLARGVGHFQGSVLPGIRDNSVLSGHRMTVFGRLGELEVGDLIVIRTSAGVFTYEVRAFRVVDKSSRDVIVPSKAAVLTLTTCYPFYTPLPTVQIFVVTSDLVHSEWSANVTAGGDPATGQGSNTVEDR